MIGLAFVRQFAAGQQIDLEVADQEIVLHYATALRLGSVEVRRGGVTREIEAANLIRL